MNNPAIKYHKNGSITYWDVYQQLWRTRPAKVVFNDDKVMSSLSYYERMRIEVAAHNMTLVQARALANKIYNIADYSGTIQADQMVDIAGPTNPEMHTCMSMESAAKALGCYYLLRDYYE